MRTMDVRKIRQAVAKLVVKANISLREDILCALKSAYAKEQNAKAKKILNILLENAAVASSEKIPICQDTGLTAVFLEIGQSVNLRGGDLDKAVNDGVKEGSKKGFLRRSVVSDPLLRVNTKDNAPAVIHIKIVPGDRVKVTVSPKGFGSENKSSIRMFRPTDNVSVIENFVLDTVKKAGPDACPPYIIGIGIGGTLDKACLLAKEALLRPLNRRHPKRHIAELEKRLLKRINGLNIGPMGLGGKTTALGLNIETYPTHIAGLPVCVSISCHATRSAALIL